MFNLCLKTTKQLFIFLEVIKIAFSIKFQFVTFHISFIGFIEEYPDKLFIVNLSIDI